MKMITNTRSFLIEVREELKKCAWPTRTELYDSTIVVIVSVVLLGAFVGVSDAILQWLMALVIR